MLKKINWPNVGLIAGVSLVVVFIVAPLLAPLIMPLLKKVPVIGDRL